ncbi:MAG TPA: response regulator [Anaerolineae bacterium]|nr:response regulator [Anaerolineae bacterium]
MENPLLLVIAGLAVLVVLLLMVAVARRGRRRKKNQVVTPAPAKTTAVPVAAPSESAQTASLTSLIGQAKVATPLAAEQKAASLRQADAAAKAAAKAEAISRPPTRLVKPGSTGDKIRILIVDDNKETRENVSRLIAFEPDMEVVGQAYNGISGLELAHEYEPHIVLMDINMPDMDGITATREMSIQVPYCQVIIISVQFEQDYMRSAMLAGARDYQTKPFSADELVNCIRRVYQSAQATYKKIEEAKRPAVVEAALPSEIAVVERTTSSLRVPLYLVYSPRGGTGVSSIAINLAAALDQIQHGAALIDTDLQFGDLPVHLNMRPTKSLADLTTSNRPDAETLPDLLIAHSSGINLLFAPAKPETAELITGSMLVQAARRLRDRSSAVVIDTGSYLTDQNLALIDIVSLVVLVITPELASVKNARIFCDMAALLGLPPERIVLVINRATMPGGIPAAQIEKAMGLSRVFQIPDDPKLRYSSVKGATIYQLDANAPSAQAISALAQGLWNLINAPPPSVENAADAKGRQPAAAAKRP